MPILTVASAAKAGDHKSQSPCHLDFAFLVCHPRQRICCCPCRCSCFSCLSFPKGICFSTPPNQTARPPHTSAKGAHHPSPAHRAGTRTPTKHPGLKARTIPISRTAKNLFQKEVEVTSHTAIGKVMASAPERPVPQTANRSPQIRKQRHPQRDSMSDSV
jgi:hypothetical protein